MKLLYRLGFYLGGFSVGLIFLAFIFNGKKTSCNYTPNARVIDNLLQKNIVLSEEVIKDYPQLKDDQIKEMIRTGTVNFSKSDTKRDSCRLYHIELQNEETAYLEVTNCSKTLNILTIKKP